MPKAIHPPDLINRRAENKVSRSAPICLEDNKRRVHNPSRSRHNGSFHSYTYLPPRHWHSSHEMGNYYPTNYTHSYYPERHLRREKLSRIDSIKKSLGKMCVAWRFCVLPSDSDTESYYKYPYPIHSYSDSGGRERHYHSHCHCSHSDGSRRGSGSVKRSRGYREDEKHEIVAQNGVVEKREEKSDGEGKHKAKPDSTRNDCLWEGQKAKPEVYKVETVKNDVKLTTKPKKDAGGGEGPSNQKTQKYTQTSQTSKRKKKKTLSKKPLQIKRPKTPKKRKKKLRFLKWIFKRKKKKGPNNVAKTPHLVTSSSSYNTECYIGKNRVKKKDYYRD